MQVNPLFIVDSFLGPKCPAQRSEHNGSQSDRLYGFYGKCGLVENGFSVQVDLDSEGRMGSTRETRRVLADALSPLDRLWFRLRCRRRFALNFDQPQFRPTADEILIVLFTL